MIVGQLGEREKIGKHCRSKKEPGTAAVGKKSAQI